MSFVFLSVSLTGGLLGLADFFFVYSKPADHLYNPEIPMPARPTISNFQWISGTQYITPKDLSMISEFFPSPSQTQSHAMSKND